MADVCTFVSLWGGGCRVSNLGEIVFDKDPWHIYGVSKVKATDSQRLS